MPTGFSVWLMKVVSQSPDKYHQTKVDKNEKKNSLEFVSVGEAYLQRMTSVKMVKNLFAPPSQKQ